MEMRAPPVTRQFVDVIVCLPLFPPPFKKPPTLLLKCDSEATKDTLVCSDASEATGYLITHDIPFRRGSGMVLVSGFKTSNNVCEVSYRVTHLVGYNLLLT